MTMITMVRDQISITVKLLADGTVIESLVVTADTDWNYSFTDLPKYKDNGTLIKYSVSGDCCFGIQGICYWI